MVSRLQNEIDVAYTIMCLIGLFSCLMIVFSIESMELNYDDKLMLQMLIYIPMCLYITFCSLSIFCSIKKSNSDVERANDTHKMVYRAHQAHTNLTQKPIAECVVCFENVQSTKLNCGHSTLCNICAHKVKECPICRKTIVQIQEEVFTLREFCGSEVSSKAPSR